MAGGRRACQRRALRAEKVTRPPRHTPPSNPTMLPKNCIGTYVTGVVSFLHLLCGCDA